MLCRTIAAGTILIVMMHAAIAEQVNGWTLASSTEKNNPIDPLCVLNSPPQADGMHLRVVNRAAPSVKGPNTKGSAFFNFTIPTAVYDILMPAFVSIVVPSQMKWEVTGTWVPSRGAGSLLLFVDRAIENVLPLLARGREISVTFPDGEVFKISLSGSSDAIKHYRECLSKVQWVGH